MLSDVLPQIPPHHRAVGSPELTTTLQVRAVAADTGSSVAGQLRRRAQPLPYSAKSKARSAWHQASLRLYGGDQTVICMHSFHPLKSLSPYPALATHSCIHASMQRCRCGASRRSNVGSCRQRRCCFRLPQLLQRKPCQLHRRPPEVQSVRLCHRRCSFPQPPAAAQATLAQQALQRDRSRRCHLREVVCVGGRGAQHFTFVHTPSGPADGRPARLLLPCLVRRVTVTMGGPAKRWRIAKVPAHNKALHVSAPRPAPGSSPAGPALARRRTAAASHAITQLLDAGAQEVQPARASVSLLSPAAARPPAPLAPFSPREAPKTRRGDPP